MSESARRFAAAGRVCVCLMALVAGLVLLAGCAAAPEPTAVPATDTPAPPSATPVPPSPTPAPPTNTPASTDTPLPPTPTETPALRTDADASGCVSCHTDEEKLRTLAKEPEQVESLSKGEG